MKKIFLCILASAFLFSGTARALTLDEAIIMGKARSLAMQSPRLDRMSIEGRITEAWSNALPQISSQLAYQRAFKAGEVFFPNPMTGEIIPLKMQQDNAMQADVTLTQPIYTFGRVAAGLRAAYAAKRSNDHMMQNTDRVVELEVMKRFWTVLMLREVTEARRASLSISDSSLIRAERMRDVGLMSDYDVLRVRVQAMNQRPPLQDAENSLRLTELSLKDFLGVPLDTTVFVEGTLGEYSLSTAIENGADDVRNRDDLEAMRELAAMQKNIYVIYRNANWPVIGGQLKYSWSWQSDEWEILSYNRTESLAGAISVSIPLWTSGYNQGRAKQYKAEWRRAELNLTNAERGAQLQYESAMRTLGTAEESETVARAAVQQAEEARRIAQTKFAQGQITPLEMDAAQLDELTARVALASAKYNRLIASAEVRMATGRPPYTKQTTGEIK